MTLPTVMNRKIVRKALSSMLRTGLGSRIQRLYEYQAGDFDGQSPVIVVHSNSADRSVSPESTLTFSVHIFLRYTDSAANPPYDESDSEDLIDDLEALISDLILAYGDNLEGDLDPATYPWLALGFVGASNVTQAVFSGIEYRHEEITVTADVSNSG